jgi:predicted lipoprotein with Yx(FWY)xxD motif
MRFSRVLFSSFVLGLVLLLAACGGSPTTTAGNGYGPTNNSATPTSAASTTGAALRTASATVNGKTVTILTDSKGMTLYYFTPDTATTTACTGGCAGSWPPLLSNSSSAPTSATSLPGALTVQTDANGKQVEYNHHLLYTYSGDTAPGQTNGEGIGNKWFVATTDLADGAGNASTPTPSSGGYGNGGGY